MTHYIGLDVSQKMIAICIVDSSGRRLWRGQCPTDPEQIRRVVTRHRGEDARVGLETGPMTPWLVHELRGFGLKWGSPDHGDHRRNNMKPKDISHDSWDGKSTIPTKYEDYRVFGNENRGGSWVEVNPAYVAHKSAVIGQMAFTRRRP
jgi:hypothetical protein